MRRGNARALERCDLILHQRDERRDDERDARQEQRGDLIAERLAPARRHDAQRIAPRENGVDEFLLPRAKRAVAVILL